MSKKKQEGLNENEEIQAQTEAQVESRNKDLDKKGDEFEKAIRALSNRDSQTVKSIARKIYGDNINVTVVKDGRVTVETETGDLITVY